MNTEKKKDLKFIIIFTTIVAFSLAYLTQTSLAKYRKQANATINVNIAQWNVVVNNESINNKTELTQSIVPSFTGNEHIKDSVIAPGSTGYCDIVISAIKVDVDFIYEITASIPEESNVPDLKITGYIIEPSETNNTEIPFDENTTITGNIQKNSEKTTIRLYIKWEEENGTMDNTQDTLAAINNGKALINTTLKFYQQAN